MVSHHKCVIFYIMFFRFYYETKSKYHESLEKQRNIIDKLEQDIAKVKSLYSKAMTNLEVISEEIHNRRSRTQHQNSGSVKNRFVYAAYACTVSFAMQLTFSCSLSFNWHRFRRKGISVVETSAIYVCYWCSKSNQVSMNFNFAWF